MAYLAGFTYDIFISYASVDNEPDAQEVRWVSRFRADLETALRRRLGKDIAIFFDQASLHAYDELEQMLKNARSSAIFLAVCSPSYVAREWTLEELKAFHTVSKSSGIPNRIVTIEVLPVEASSLPDELENLKRTRFYTSDKETGTDFALTPASQPLLYNERLQQLAHQLVLLFRELQNRPAPQTVAEQPVPRTEAAAETKPARPAAAPEPAPNVPPPTTPAEPKEPVASVLLAQVTDDVYDERQKVASYLEDYGVKVVPVGEYPSSGAAFATAVDADLDHADLFVQLFGRVRSFKPEDLRSEGGPSKSYAQFQYDAARRHNVPVLQWRHPEIRLDQMPAINWDRQLLEGPDVRVMGLQDFMKEIRTAVGRLAKKEEPKPARGDFIFINADSSDQDLAQKLLKALNDNDCYAVVPMHDGSAKEIEEDLEANLIDCRGLLLVYGKASLAWVRAQIRRFIKVENRRQEPLRVKRILRGPPLAKPDVGVSGFQMIDLQEGTTAERMEKIVKELRM